MNINEELNSFVEQTFLKFAKVGVDFRGTFLEEDFRRNLETTYIQCKFITENIDKSIILNKKAGDEKQLLAFRRGELFRKLFYEPLRQIKENKNPKFVWETYETEILAEEYIDLIMDTLSSLFEYYHSLLKNNELFDCVKLARKLNITALLPKLDKIDRADLLNLLYVDLSEKTAEQYTKETESLFSMDAYKVRNACFHMSYSYKKEGDSDFKIFFNTGTDGILYTELLKLTRDIMAKINVLIIIPYYFSEGALPLKTG